MNHVNTRKVDVFFQVLAGTARSQAASMNIAPAAASGEDESRHRADQWLFVVEGTGAAIIEGRQVVLEPGSLLLVEAGERHQIRNTGSTVLRTINIYAPPAY